MTTISQSRLYELNFATLPALERAFSDALSCPFLEDCLADADTLRLFFMVSDSRIWSHAIVASISRSRT